MCHNSLLYSELKQKKKNKTQKYMKDLVCHHKVFISDAVCDVVIETGSVDKLSTVAVQSRDEAVRTTEQLCI